MTAHTTLRALARLTQHARVSGRGTSTSCSGAGPPAKPPPCKPQPRPPCRGRPDRTVRALRVVCCPPAAGHRPPCPPKEQTPSLTCADASKGKTSMHCGPPRLEGASAPINCGSDNHGDCGAGQDRVARRLALAKAVRRKDYECEAALPRERVHTVPYAKYKLGCERECARATDGRDYSVPCECPERAEACGSGRSPPPPRCVDLTPDDGCRIDTGAHLDPCAHRPRILLRIDRSAPSDHTTKCEPCPSPRTLKSRIMESLKPRPNKGSNPLTSKGKDSPQCGRRYLHVSTQSLGKECAPGKVASKEKTKKSGSLESMMQERAQLHEVGRGRAVCGASNQKRSCPGVEVGGQLELPVPGGVRRVRVHVAMEDDCGVPLIVGAGGAPRGQCDAMSETKDSWLSIKNIQKKLSGCRDETVSKRKACEPKTGPVPTNPCGSPQTKPPPPAKLSPRKPCPPKTGTPVSWPPKKCPTNPCAPKKPQKKEKEKPKPVCRFLPLGLTAAPIP